MLSGVGGGEREKAEVRREKHVSPIAIPTKLESPPTTCGDLRSFDVAQDRCAPRGPALRYGYDFEQFGVVIFPLRAGEKRLY
jgi:hypothetical protein